ncbi:MAG: 2-oxoglutarate dehydrogenase E1 component [Candidatus Krumholzibacteria bacterium]|nr:2-oxoglutarate dehydrogenase E1 component [Candidatus Krumholzibacteria bacterium]
MSNLRNYDTLADAFRRWGYLAANLDPLERIVPFTHPDLADAIAAAKQDDVDRWRSIYSSCLGIEFMHMVDREKVDWMRETIEKEMPEVDVRRILGRLMESEMFERFLHSRYVGSKRFSIDGIAGLITLLDSILETASDGGAEYLYIGMSHRGRINVMKNIVGIPTEDIFASMEDVDPRSVLGAGDVKYHMGATGRYETPGGKFVEVHLATNPSHLESVDAVVMGRTRGRQDRWGENSRTKYLPVTCHGDAAFAGQGITSETLNFADLPDYTVGGTIRIVVNNLVGFTAQPKSLHSTRFASDAAKRLSIPIIHVNGEAPRAISWAGKIATEFRNQFRTDVVVDIIGYRRFGHSEVEDPTLTQPLLYQKIKDRLMLWEIFAQRIGESQAVVEKMREDVMTRLSERQEIGRSKETRPTFWELPDFWGRYHGGLYDSKFDQDTGVDLTRLKEITERITTTPLGFNVHPKMEKFLTRRREMTEGNRRVDWGTAEALAIGSLLWDGVRVRLTGQDSRRGTFNHRHAVLMDVKTAAEYVPLEQLRADQGEFTVVDSPLSEAAALGFEYGYSRELPDGLVMWEAQFGDFANGAQIIIDQFLSAAEDKWKLLSGIVLLLPHGYEGQGPEHSSARIERFLELAAEDNMQMCQPSTSAQYFHILRQQALRTWTKPLVLFMPKSVLRAEPACSDVSELTAGRFQHVIQDKEVGDAKAIILCSGKIAHELRAYRKKRNLTDRAIVTIEQFYPFPEDQLVEAIARHGKNSKVIWVQEEPSNMGALNFLRPKLKTVVGNRWVTSVKRYESAGPATGSAKAHKLEQQTLLELAFA